MDSYDTLLQHIARSVLVEAAKSLVQVFILSRLVHCNLQRTIAQFGRQADEMPAIGTERCRTADNRCIIVQPHHTITATVPLATSMTTCRFQDRRPGFPLLD